MANRQAARILRAAADLCIWIGVLWLDLAEALNSAAWRASGHPHLSHHACLTAVASSRESVLRSGIMTVQQARDDDRGNFERIVRRHPQS